MERHCVDAADHADWAGETCPTCGEVPNQYGNTESDPAEFCSFTACGCDGARLCMARQGPSSDANECNVEGMWSGKTRVQRRAGLKTLGLVLKEAGR